MSNHVVASKCSASALSGLAMVARGIVSAYLIERDPRKVACEFLSRNVLGVCASIQTHMKIRAISVLSKHASCKQSAKTKCATVTGSTTNSFCSQCIEN